MTTYRPNNDAPRTYVTAKMAQVSGKAKARTDADIERKVKDSVKRNASIHKSLAKL